MANLPPLRRPQPFGSPYPQGDERKGKETKRKEGLPEPFIMKGDTPECSRWFSGNMPCAGEPAQSVLPFLHVSPALPGKTSNASTPQVPVRSSNLPDALERVSKGNKRQKKQSRINQSKMSLACQSSNAQDGRTHSTLRACRSSEAKHAEAVNKQIASSNPTPLRDRRRARTTRYLRFTSHLSAIWRAEFLLGALFLAREVPLLRIDRDDRFCFALSDALSSDPSSFARDFLFLA